MREAQLRLIRDGEAVVHTQEPNQGSLLNEEQEETEQDAQQDIFGDEIMSNEQTKEEGEA